MRWYLSTSPYGIVTQETNIDIFSAVRTSDLTKEERLDISCKRNGGRGARKEINETGMK
jgi:hypothetical protein